MESIDFLFVIDKHSKKQISTQIYEKIKIEIFQSKYKFQDKLPSIRNAAEKLNVSKSSIISAYFQLSTEGYIENKPCKGYFICKISNIQNEKTSFDLDFKEDNIVYINDAIDKDAFSKDLWRKNYVKILQDENLDLGTLGDEQGEFELRVAIANFIRTHRACNTNAEQIIVASGIQNLISLLIKITKDKYNFAFLEYPCYKKVEYIFDDFSINKESIAVKDSGIDIDKFGEKKNSFIYTSPSYQYPLGTVMPIDKRFELIRYANRNDCLIIEDDYASIIRYDSKPISSLQGLDIYDNTVYLGSFSKTFLPSLRISFMVLPKKILPDYYSIKAKYTHTCSKLEQLTLAKVISSGQMEKHLKKINNIYKQKNQIISRYIKEKYKKRLIVHNNQSGFHIILSCKTKRDISFLEDFKNEFLLVNIIEFKEENLLFSFSYSGLSNEEIPQIIDSLVKILEI